MPENHSERSPWARPKPREHTSAQSSGIEIAEPPHEIEIPRTPATQPLTLAPPDYADDAEADPRLVPIALLIVAVVAAAAVLWAALV